MGNPQNTETLQQLCRSLEGRAVSLVLFDTPKGEWRFAFEALTADAELAELHYIQRIAGSGSAPGLYKREEWKPGPHWALLDKEGKVLSHGATVPTLSALKAAVEATGRKSLLQELRSFVAQHPENAEALETFVLQLRNVAQRRALAALGQHRPSPPDPGLAPVGFSDASGFTHSNVPSEEEKLAKIEAKDLGTEQDQAIWSEYTRELLKVFAQEGWAALPFPGTYKVPHGIQVTLATPLARFSPLCREAYLLVLPKIEALLERFPSHGRAWQLWSDFALATKRDAKPLLASLTPVPGAATDWPPVILRQTLLLQARESGDWRTVADLSAEVFDRVLDLAKGERTYATSGQARKGYQPTPWLDERLWCSTVSPLIEAHLAQNHSKLAEEVLSIWDEYGGWNGAYTKASELARKAKLEDLAKAWEKKAE
ncbi:MAG: hypothetical protein Q8O00_01790 [Holophaga sp.]|nr:hypothetical protein [Holophaga sp.]